VLTDFDDIDIPAMWLAEALGMIEEGSGMGRNKWVFWSTNPAGDAIFRFVRELQTIGYLEDHPDQPNTLRINPNFSLKPK
jgi:hypothetical protein